MSIKGVKKLVAEANARIESVTAEEAIKLAANDNVTIIDIRDIHELYREGKIPGAEHPQKHARILV